MRYELFPKMWKRIENKYFTNTKQLEEKKIKRTFRMVTAA